MTCKGWRASTWHGLHLARHGCQPLTIAENLAFSAACCEARMLLLCSYQLFPVADPWCGCTNGTVHTRISNPFSTTPRAPDSLIEHTLCSPIVSFLGTEASWFCKSFLHTLFASGGREKYPQCRPISTSMPPVETKFQRLPFSRSMHQSNGTTWNILYPTNPEVGSTR